jgi:serine/threonine-protein kinase HipA
MASSLWGKVYYGQAYAGELRQEPGGRCVFTYDTTYLADQRPAIAVTLPRSHEPTICEAGLHAYFDNLVAEGWLRNAQARALRIDPNNRFALLLAFGHDCAGAVSVIDPAPPPEPFIDFGDPATTAALASRASLSGVQPKLFAVRDGKRYRPVGRAETSRYIAKLPSGSHPDIIQNEYITTEACRALLPDDRTVELEIASVEGIEGRALLIDRFDRLPSGAKIHFEEFNQLLGRRSGDDKYDAAYDDMAAFILKMPDCTRVDAWRLYRRELVCFLTGNTDAHLKNFAMLHTREGLRLTPAYDLVSAALYPQYRTLALAIGRAAGLKIEDLKPNHIVALGATHGLSSAEVEQTIRALDQRRPAAERAVRVAAKRADAAGLGDNLLNFMERRWNGTFASIGAYLSRKRSSGDGR